ncbi:Male-specific lethal 1-like 1 [Nymphon striatum]|nr:Male-specific lethal 1-like 1 [Nymphon striatum]
MLMTGSRMKSDIFQNPRNKSEPKSIVLRRKIQRSGVLNLNGNSECCVNSTSNAAENGVLDLNTSCYDNLKRIKTETIDGKANMSNIFDNLSSSLQTGYNLNGSSQKSQIKLSNKEKDNEIKQLKELLILNLSLIKQQNEQILSKEKQLKDKNNQHEILKNKIQDLENRLNSRTSLFNKSYSKTSSSDSNRYDRQKISDNANRIKRKYKQKGFISLKRKSSDRNISLNSRKKDEHVSQRRTGRTLKKDEFCMTSRPYFVNSFCIPKLESISTNNSPTKDANVQVPTWRLNPVSSCYSMEGTENLDDDVFLKRHSKFELDERRRKRWDIQRIREQRMAEKLKLRYDKIKDQPRKLEKMKSKTSSEIFTLLDEEEREVKYMHITEMIYVNAFNHLIPYFKPEEFSIPWYQNDQSDADTSNSRKSQASETSFS